VNLSANLCIIFSPFSVHVDTSQINSTIADDHTIWVEHWHDVHFNKRQQLFEI
jgi:hypothetical protein